MAAFRILDLARLAEEYETRIARDTASELQPNAQQQQQVQPKEPEEDST